ncbi:MAG: aldehyde dehydrogenase family protein [Actinobacteria bacterium]|nr:aldehyde dehydrogenase family protein [Actinomycetota bacterium]
MQLPARGPAQDPAGVPEGGTPASGAVGCAHGLAAELRSNFATGFTRPLPWRREQLQVLARMLRQGAGGLVEAMREDMGKPPTEAWLTDIAAVRKDIESMARELGRWAAPKRVRVPWQLWPGRAEVVAEPLGTVLVLGPWNYPVRCVVLPLASALAAGNTVVAKPSELAPSTAAELARLAREHLDAEAVRFCLGGPDVAQALLAQQWDHVFFTGSSRVGRLVMAAAARHLTPVTLELGGKNPALVAASADIKSAARRIAWGKFLNAGQTCVAVDYVVVEREAESALLEQLRHWLTRFYGEDPRLSLDFGRIVNAAHVDRLACMLDATKARTVLGGEVLAGERYVAPTVLAGVSWDDPVMQEEIFGPVLPVLTCDNIASALAEIRQRDKPLAVYLYARERDLEERVISESSSGGVCVNHNAVQLAVPGLPFGGVGASGMGAYHAKAGFDTFSHQKAVLRKPAGAEVPLMYPPYGRLKQWVLRKVV